MDSKSEKQQSLSKEALGDTGSFYGTLLQTTLERLAHLDLTEFAQYNDNRPYAYGGFCDVFRGEIKKNDISESIIIHGGQLEINIAIKRLRAHIKKDIARVSLLVSRV